jgi:hypothetical protein
MPAVKVVCSKFSVFYAHYSNAGISLAASATALLCQRLLASATTTCLGLPPPAKSAKASLQK